MGVAGTETLSEYLRHESQEHAHYYVYIKFCGCANPHISQWPKQSLVVFFKALGLNNFSGRRRAWRSEIPGAAGSHFSSVPLTVQKQRSWSLLRSSKVHHTISTIFHNQSLSPNYASFFEYHCSIWADVKPPQIGGPFLGWRWWSAVFSALWWCQEYPRMIRLATMLTSCC